MRFCGLGVDDLRSFAARSTTHANSASFLPSKRHVYSALAVSYLSPACMKSGRELCFPASQPWTNDGQPRVSKKPKRPLPSKEQCGTVCLLAWSVGSREHNPPQLAQFRLRRNHARLGLAQAGQLELASTCKTREYCWSERRSTGPADSATICIYVYSLIRRTNKYFFPFRAEGSETPLCGLTLGV